MRLARLALRFTDFFNDFQGKKNLTVLQSTIPSYVEALFKGAVSWLASLFSFVKSQLCVLSFFAMEFEKLLTNDKTQQRVMLAIVSPKHKRYRRQK